MENAEAACVAATVGETFEFARYAFGDLLGTPPINVSRSAGR